MVKPVAIIALFASTSLAITSRPRLISSFRSLNSIRGFGTLKNRVGGTLCEARRGGGGKGGDTWKGNKGYLAQRDCA
eukprot:1395053-Amorphochlora_amoeboformis.AAC.1